MDDSTAVTDASDEKGDIAKRKSTTRASLDINTGRGPKRNRSVAASKTSKKSGRKKKVRIVDAESGDDIASWTSNTGQDSSRPMELRPRPKPRPITTVERMNDDCNSD
jgi:hypothetical protein